MTSENESPAVAALACEAVGLLRERGETLATAESLTGGLLSGAVTAVPGSSAAYDGGLVTYATRLKVGLLGVSPELVERHGVVSGECARAMAEGAARVVGADWALATTGVAGPDLQEGHPAGTVHVGLRAPGGVVHSRELGLSGDREGIREQSVEAALRWLCEELRGGPPRAKPGDSHPG